MSWHLERISIEGFRGINNSGDPLELRFHPNKVNSVFAPNGVGKSSIFEAVTYALMGEIPKLEKLPAAEEGPSYYLNRFHPANLGTVRLTLVPTVPGGQNITITVTRDGHGNRAVATSDGSDGNIILSALNREFVLLDAKTFQDFIDETPLNRGRSFSGLLGLGSYSNIRQGLQALSNTRAFNNHFEIGAKAGKKQLILRQITQFRANIVDSYLSVAGEAPDPKLTNLELRDKASAILCNIPLIKAQCEGRTFDDVSPDDCLATVRDAEGGVERERLSKLLQIETGLSGALSALPTREVLAQLVDLARERDAALKQTQGDAFLRLYKLTEQITSQADWVDKNICPACEHQGDHSVLEHARVKMALYDAVTNVSDRLTTASASIDWDRLLAGEQTTEPGVDQPVIKRAKDGITGGTFDEALAVELQNRAELVRELTEKRLAAARTERAELENRLPPSLVAVTEKIEAARRLQASLKNEEASQSELTALNSEIARVEKIRDFLNAASAIFAKAEAKASARRLAAVQPLCREYFEKIVFERVVPTISKRDGSEELQISLDTFHDLPNVSARSVLSESYRNAFAISVYLAAASLYGGAAKFLLLDDVTSSLDAGHQFHLMEVIRTRFSRPGNPVGPQVILLSHDTLLEKYFNTNGSTPSWSHQRIEGTPRTAVLPQSNAVNRVHASTMALLQAGNVQDAAPRIRQYLEYTLEKIIIECKIAVPMAVAMNDDRHMAGELIKAIDAQVKLHQAANTISLQPIQINQLNTTAGTIVANYLAHWSTGQTQAFSAPALLGVMQAIDDYAACFKYQPNPGDPLKFYKSLRDQQ